MATTSTYPVSLELDAPLKVARWRPLVHWLLAVPQYIVLYALALVAGALSFIAWFAILFTGNIPEGLFGVLVMTHRYQWRVASYLLFMRESYPPFEFPTTAADPGTDPARVTIEYPERLSRGLIFVKWLLVIPHLIVLYVLAVAALFVWLAGFFAVLFTGRWPQGLRDFLVGVSRWSLRVQAYAYLLTDVYPPFALAA